MDAIAQGIGRHFVIACLALGLTMTASSNAAELQTETLRAYREYIRDVRRSFDERVAAGRALSDVADTGTVMRDGQVLVQAVRGDGIVPVPGGLIHHWRAVAFIPKASLREAIAVSQDYANYKHVYEPVREAAVLEQHGETFRVLIRLHKGSGLVSAVLDVWSVVVYQQNGDGVMYSVSESERVAEVENAGRPDERRLRPDQGTGYLWRTSTFSRLAEQEAGVLVELENLGLSRSFPPLLGWIIEPIARRIGRSSVEDSVVEFRTAVVAAHSARTPAVTNR